MHLRTKNNRVQIGMVCVLQYGVSKHKTNTDRNIEYLLSLGWIVNTDTRVSKRIEMTHADVDYKYYIGKRGSVRRGKTVASSIPVRFKIFDSDNKPVSNAELGSISPSVSPGE